MQSNLSFLVSQLFLFPLRLGERILWVSKTPQTFSSCLFPANGRSTFFSLQSHCHQASEAMPHPFQINFERDSNKVSIIRKQNS